MEHLLWLLVLALLLKLSSHQEMACPTAPDPIKSSYFGPTVLNVFVPPYKALPTLPAPGYISIQGEAMWMNTANGVSEVLASISEGLTATAK